MSAAFTPGPWMLRSALSATVLARREHTNAIGETREWYGPVAIAQPWTSEKERLANALLIAAAPELYEALLSLRDWATSGQVPIAGVIQSADAAIAKAQGEQ